MSVDISWETITGGSDGEALALKIREFIHDKFQQVVLPRFLKSVQVHDFKFGSTCPQVEIKDISDPLPDFYEDDEDGSSGDDEGVDDREFEKPIVRQLPDLDTARANTAAFVEAQDRQHNRFASETGFPGIARAGTPGIPGGTSNFSYFHMPIGSLSGVQTPLAAVASGTPFTPVGWPMDRSQSPILNLPPARRMQHSQTVEHNDPSTRPSTATTLLTHVDYASDSVAERSTGPQKVADDPSYDFNASSMTPGLHNVGPTDMQVVARVQYSGDISLMLTAEILLDYPMPSFVGIPLKLSITGMTFDGVAIVAYIKKRMHFCFLDPEDAETLVGDHVMQDDTSRGSNKQAKSRQSMNNLGLLQDIQIESEIGRQESGKQVLKNVGKVERFVLEQVRRIFEEEFVFPSFWTFLV